MADNTSDGSNTAGTNTTPPPSTTTAVGAAAASSSTSAAAAAVAAAAINPKEEWKSLTPMTTIRFRAGCILINDHQFLVIGRVDENGKYLSSCEYYDRKTEAWNSLPINMPTCRFSFGVARVGNRVYVMGGNVGSDDNDYIGSSSLISIVVSGNDLSTLSAANKWKTLAPMNEVRYAFACVSHLNFIYVFGGYTDKEWLNKTDTAERYNIDTNQWEKLPNMPDIRSSSSAGVVGNKIYVVGGRDGNRNKLSTTIAFNTTKQQWEPSTAVPDMKTKRSWLSVVIVDHFVIAIGGRNESTIEVLDTQRNSWNDAPTQMNHGRESFVAGFLKETNDIIVAGGMDNDDDGLNTPVSISFEKGFLPSVSLE